MKPEEKDSEQQQHTAEPWHVAEDGVSVQSGPEGMLAYVSTAGARGRKAGEARANAARIVACVNACSGMVDPVGEIMSLMKTQEFTGVRFIKRRHP